MQIRKPVTDTPGPEHASFEGRLREKVRASMADPLPSIAAADVFKRLRARHRRRVKAANNGP